MSREHRVPIMMSDEEIAFIDDWRFKNRIATRSDAIRRLCGLGMKVEANNVMPTIDECHAMAAQIGVRFIPHSQPPAKEQVA